MIVQKIDFKTRKVVNEYKIDLPIKAVRMLSIDGASVMLLEPAGEGFYYNVIVADSELIPQEYDTSLDKCYLIPRNKGEN